MFSFILPPSFLAYDPELTAAVLEMSPFKLADPDFDIYPGFWQFDATITMFDNEELFAEHIAHKLSTRPTAPESVLKKIAEVDFPELRKLILTK